MVSTPDEAARKKCGEESEAVVELNFGAGEVELVAEPVDIEEWGGEFEEDEGWGIEVDKGPLPRRDFQQCDLKDCLCQNRV